MMTASELAGFIAAHAIWCISDDDGLIPILAFGTEDGQRQMERLVFDDTAAAVEHGRRRLDADPFGANDGVLAYDARIALADGKLDAILLEMRSYAFPRARVTIAVPYTPSSSGRFRIHKPKMVEWDGCDDFDLDAVFGAFFQGASTHEPGVKVWDAALDESR